MFGEDFLGKRKEQEPALPLLGNGKLFTWP